MYDLLTLSILCTQTAGAYLQCRICHWLKVLSWLMESDIQSRFSNEHLRKQRLSPIMLRLNLSFQYYSWYFPRVQVHLTQVRCRNICKLCLLHFWHSVWWLVVIAMTHLPPGGMAMSQYLTHSGSSYSAGSWPLTVCQCICHIRWQLTIWPMCLKWGCVLYRKICVACLHLHVPLLVPNICKTCAKCG